MYSALLHVSSAGGGSIGHVINQHIVSDILVGVFIALCLFGLYYRLILVPASERQTSQGSPPPGNTGN
ncbi:hypothetical protein ACOZ4I_12475 [Haloarcula salina]|uniref:hypothetical protein n=1 Tax=Haloarcula salina TaxID=1429914 RepID=UPI003C702D26